MPTTRLINAATGHRGAPFRPLRTLTMPEDGIRGSHVWKSNLSHAIDRRQRSQRSSNYCIVNQLFSNQLGFEPRTNGL